MLQICIHTCLRLVSFSVHSEVSRFLSSERFQFLLNHIHRLLSTESIRNWEIQYTVKEKFNYFKLLI